ncbi:sigma-70 family RNA polymerase sigma factor [Maricaulis sp. D1M11]|uniref:sigma-70 family RNA polymerase sigma factor n=1 Tax=Maricaulis sp. D1M11 TaxID=3076117 RepID=UPI0039B62904
MYAEADTLIRVASDVRSEAFGAMCMGKGETERTDSAAAELNRLLVRVGADADRAAYKQLFDYYAPRIRAFLRGRRLSGPQVDDLTQDALLTIWRRASTFDPAKASASTWVFTVVRNLQIDLYRKEKRRGDLPEHEPELQAPETPQPDQMLTRSEDVGRVKTAMMELPADQKDVLDLAFGQGFSHREIADHLDLPLGTVKSRVRLAMAKMRVLIGDWE